MPVGSSVEVGIQQRYSTEIARLWQTDSPEISPGISGPLLHCFGSPHDPRLLLSTSLCQNGGRTGKKTRRKWARPQSSPFLEANEVTGQAFGMYRGVRRSTSWCWILKMDHTKVGDAVEPAVGCHCLCSPCVLVISIALAPAKPQAHHPGDRDFLPWRFWRLFRNVQNFSFVLHVSPWPHDSLEKESLPSYFWRFWVGDAWAYLPAGDGFPFGSYSFAGQLCSVFLAAILGRVQSSSEEAEAGDLPPDVRSHFWKLQQREFGRIWLKFEAPVPTDVGPFLY